MITLQLTIYATTNVINKPKDKGKIGNEIILLIN
jgi:hypothetical protein